MGKTKVEKLAVEITDLLDKYELGYQTALYFNNKRLSQFTNKIWKEEKNLKGSDYVEYANDDTITMTFEGSFYEVINYGILPSVLEEFTELLRGYGYYYELGDAWNLSLYED